MLHYNFPPFSTGEVKPIRGTSRREVGHGALAERALQALLPPYDQFPYTLRIVSDILESNGSSSMATVCGGSLALFDAGVPMTAACAGVAMGLIKEGKRVAVLTDILGTEDHLGDMDFKVAGTRQGVSSIQMDIKIECLDFQIVSQALEKAKKARLHVLDIMDQVMAKPRSELSKYAPRIITIQIRPDKIGDLIGPKGKTIRGIQEQTGAEINVDDNGLVTISAVGEGGERARDMVSALVQEPEVGKVYEGVVKSTTAFGAFVEILPGVEGLLHISELQHGRTERTEDVVKKGDHVPRPKMGVSHLLEHMVFKGTERRSAQEIALALESRGGSLDAYTSRDTTAFQARVLDSDLPRALDVLTDLVRNPVLRSSDLELERNVVLEEINTVEDTPDDQVFDLVYQTLWPKHSYGYSILGTRDTVSALSTDDLKQLHGRAYFPANCVIAAAGNLTHDALLEELGRQGWFDASPGTAVSGNAQSATVPPAVRGTEARHSKDSAQTHIVFATDTVPYADRRKYALLVLANVFGGGMSSRLFQRIREELGLAYAIYAFTSFYREVGVTGVYVGTQPKTAVQAAAAIREEYARLAREGLAGAALAEAKQQTQGQLMLSLESPSARMYRLASFPVYGEPYRGLDEVVTAVAGLTEKEIADVAAEFFDPERQTVVWLGPEERR